MYSEIQASLLKYLKSKRDPKLLARKLNLGAAIKEIKGLEKISTKEILQKTGLKRSALNAILFEQECNTTLDKIKRILEAFNIRLDELIAVAREKARYNFYLQVKDSAPRFAYEGGQECAKVTPETTHEVTIYSPPIFNARDFIWAFVSIEPGKSITDIHHPTIKEVACFVVSGHLKVRYGSQEYTEIGANQLFHFDPRVSHDFINQEAFSKTDVFILFHLNPTLKAQPPKRKKTVTAFDTASLIDIIREEISPDPENLISCNTVSQLSGIDYSSISYLLYGKPKVLFLDKIDSLCALSRLPFESLIQKSENRYQGWFKVYGENDKAVIDYRLQHGMRIDTHTLPGTGLRHFGISDVTFESIQMIEKRRQWRICDPAFLGLKVEKGVLEIQYGKQPPQELGWGDTVYVNADIPITLSNALSINEAEKRHQSPECKIRVFSHPPLL